MKVQHETHADDLQVQPLSLIRRMLVAKVMPVVICTLIVLVGILTAPSARAQAIRFQFNQLRATVPVNSTSVTLLGISPNTNNSVVLVNFVAPDLSYTNKVTNVVFSVSGLPANASAVFVDGNGNALPSTTQSTNLFLQLYTTNITEGTYYTFTLNANGLDSSNNVVTNSFPFVLQSAHIWKGSGYGSATFLVSNDWANATSWFGGVPNASSEVVFTDYGGQTNIESHSQIGFTNVGVNASMTIGSLRFAQAVSTNAFLTNALVHTIQIASGATLAVTGSNGFSLMRDYISEFGYTPDATMGVNFVGVGGTLLVTNAAANFQIMVPSGTQPTLSVSNLGTMVTYVNRMAFSDYTVYPNYAALTAAYNAGHDATNYQGIPRKFWNNVYLAKTNIITAVYKNPDNYTNEFTRQYAMCLQNNEQSGNGSSQNTYFFLGISNMFYMDSVCLVGSSSASGNTGGVLFGKKVGSSAFFRGTNGGRMSVFSISDDGGTNMASSNVKATVDFSGTTNYVDILADRLYIARDRTMVASNQAPNVQGDLTIGYGKVDVNTVVLGYQEHSNKVDWTSAPYHAQPYLNYCEGRLVLTNGAGNSNLGSNVFRVNGNMYLGYTADLNPPASAQQYNTYGRVTIYSNATLIVSNIICDGGLNFYASSSGRQNTIAISQGGNLVVSNTVGYPNLGADDLSGFAAADPRGMVLDSLNITAGKLTLNIDPSRTNIFVRSISTPGTTPGIIKVAQVTGVSSFPVQIPVISYQGTASPFLTADVSALNGAVTYFGYVINNSANKTIDVYITTNVPNNLIWTGAVNNNWDTTTLNWKTAVGGLQTNFNLGDIAAFDDSSTAVNVFIPDFVVPNQTGVGVLITNNVNQYSFSGGTIAGTAQVIKAGTNSMEFDVTEQGPISILGGNVTVNNNGGLGSTTLATNLFLNIISGTINGGLTSTGTVSLANGTLNGQITLQAGWFVNSGTINTLVGNVITMASGANFTNLSAGTINLGAGTGSGAAWDVPFGSILANFGQINMYQPKVQIEGLLFGNGNITDPNGGGYDGFGNNPSRVDIRALGVLSPGLTPNGSLSSMNLVSRLDWDNDPTANGFGVGTLRIEVDFSNPQTNDFLNCDRWNNDTGFLLMTNINPSAGVFSNGLAFTIFNNTSFRGTNYIDTVGFCPTIQPYTPGPGLVWGVTNFNVYGTLSITTNTMVWDGLSSVNWSTNSDLSWKNPQVYSDSLGAFFGDSASGSTTVNLTTTVAPAGTTATAITNNATIFPGIVISNAIKNYVFTGIGRINGPTSIYKTGPGTLSLLTSNDFIGNTILQNGTLIISNFNTSANIVALGVAGSGQMKNEVLFDGGELDYVGKTNVTLNNNTVFNAAIATISVISPTNVLTMAAKAPVGNGTLVKTGPGNLNLSQGTAQFLGGVNVNGGTLRLSAANAVGPGNLTLNNGVVLETTNFTLVFTNTLNVAGTGVGFNFLSNSPNVLSGPLIGAGSVTFSNVNQFVFSGSLSNFSGSISFGGTSANYQFNNTTNKASTNGNPCRGSALASFDLGTGFNTLSNYNGGGLTYFLGALSGGPNTILGGRATNTAELPTTTIYNIGANGTNTTFSGKIADGFFGAADSVTIIKSGSGALLLNGNSTYSGSTTVSNGVLGGTGSIASALTVLPGATLSPGVSIGTFTVNNSATLGGAVLMELNQANPGQTNDLLVITGALSGTGGTLTVTNIGPTLTNGATFKLFSKPVTFTTVNLPTGGTGYQWTNNLAVDGSITLGSGGIIPYTPNPTPTNIVTSVSANTLTLSWPADHIGWRLLVQTNPLSRGLYTNWFTVTGSTTTNSISTGIDTNAGSIFYRLVLP